MKKLFIPILMTVLLFNGVLFAQNKKGEKIKAYKTAYITESLDLTSKEAEQFWPIYNEFEKKMYKYRFGNVKNEQRKIKEKGGIDALNDAEAETLLQGILTNEKEISKAKQQLYKDLNNVISSKKILKLYKAEHEFNRKLLSQFRKNQGKQSRPKD